MGSNTFSGKRLITVLILTATVLAPVVAAAPPAAAGGARGESLARIDALPPGAPAEAILLLDSPIGAAQERRLQAAGLGHVEPFDFISAAGATGTPAALARALDVPGVRAVYPAEPLESHLAESRRAISADGVPGELGLSGRNVTIAVVDSGIDGGHPGFDGRLLAGVKFNRDGHERSMEDRDGHGTHIAGIAAGSGAGSEDHRLRGVAPGARLVGLDISDAFTTANAIRAFQWIHEHRADYDIGVVSNSWGRERDDAHYDAEDPVIRATNALVEEGVVVVFSAGNRGDARATLTVEAMNPNALTVGATDDSGRVEEYSSRGPAVDAGGDPLPWVKPDVVAPGTAIVSARTQHRDAGDLSALVAEGEGRYYVAMNGTSMAAPHVAGVAALLLEKNPTLTPLAVKAILQETAADRGRAGPDPDYGHGLVDARGAVQALANAGEREVVVTSERTVPFHFEGEALAAAGSVVLHDQSVQAPPAAAVTHAVEVPEGATALDLAFAWEGAQGAFALFLQGGGETFGPFEASDDGVVRAAVEAPAPGEWEVRAEPRGAVAQGAYHLEGSVTVVETRVVTQPGADSARTWGGSLMGEGGFFEEQARRDMVRRVLTRPWTAPAAPLAAVALGVGLLVVVARRRGGWPPLPEWMSVR